MESILPTVFFYTLAATLFHTYKGFHARLANISPFLIIVHGDDVFHHSTPCMLSIRFFLSGLFFVKLL